MGGLGGWGGGGGIFYSNFILFYFIILFYSIFYFFYIFLQGGSPDRLLFLRTNGDGLTLIVSTLVVPTNQ